MTSRRSFCRNLTLAIPSVTSALRADDRLRFKPAPGLEFDTGLLRGRLHENGRSTGLSSVVHAPSGIKMSRSMGLFSHYRVFTTNRRWVKGAWDWKSTVTVRNDGSVDVVWLMPPDVPFELRAHYRWSGPATLDLETQVRALADLPDFEAFLASYLGETFTNSLVYVREHPGAGNAPGFTAAEQSYGAWQMFPRDPRVVPLIRDGRWKIDPNPVDWVIMPELAQPLGMRRDPSSGITAILMAPSKDCFAISTPHQTEGHYSMYLSLFGRTIKAGETVRARARLVIADAPGDEEILGLYREYVASLT